MPMRTHEEAPHGIRPRYVVTQLTHEQTGGLENGYETERLRTFYIVDLRDHGRVIWKVEGGRFSPYAWGEARKTAEGIARRMNNKYERALLEARNAG